MDPSETCDQKTAEQDRIIKEWRSKWPNFCKHCSGYGQFHDPGYWDAKAGHGLPPSDEPCGYCTGGGNCARCGQPTLWSEGVDEELLPCRNCGWNDDDGLPEPHECYGDCQPHCSGCEVRIETGELGAKGAGEFIKQGGRWVYHGKSYEDYPRGELTR